MFHTETKLSFLTFAHTNANPEALVDKWISRNQPEEQKESWFLSNQCSHKHAYANPGKWPPKCLTTHLTRLEPQRDATCSIIFHNINTVEPQRDWMFHRWARGRQRPGLCARTQREWREELHAGARCWGAGTHGDQLCACLGKGKGHTQLGCPWGRANRREIHQWEEQPLWGVR